MDKATPEEKCSHELKEKVIQWLRLCLTSYRRHWETEGKEKPKAAEIAATGELFDAAVQEIHELILESRKKKPSPSPEARCLCKSGIRGKHCFDYHPAEARVDWEKEARKSCQHHYKDNCKQCKAITKALSAAFEKGREEK